MKFDVQDVLLVLGVVSLVLGVGLWSIPAALVLFGLLCLAAVMLMQRDGSAGKAAAEKVR